MRYFTVTSLVAFAAVAIALYFLERADQTFFQAVQHEQNDFFAQAQAEFVRAQKEAARGNLLMVHEAGHVTLTSLFANALWDTHFAPLVAKAQGLPVDRCRGLGQGGMGGFTGEDPARRACFADLGRRITSLPGFAAVDSAVHAMMRKSTVFKIKVYDLRGLTVYSSEPDQIGEDKADNLGWKSAVSGKPASELVHRDRFSAFEGTVENRDLIQSYIPVLAPGGGRISGVFEIYSDVTPFLRQIDAVSAKIGDVTAANQARVEGAALENQRKVESNSTKLFVIVGGLLALLYVALLVFVRNGQRIIDEQARVREQAALREQLWHREKMAALATMAANASHEVGNPLAIISGLAQEIGRAQAAGEPLGDQPRVILEQTARIAKMTRQITEFATARNEASELVDINQMIKAVCDFLGFDRRFRETYIELQLADQLPAWFGIPGHLNEVLMSLLEAHAERSMKAPASGGRILVRTEARGDEVMIGIGCRCAPSGDACAPDDTDPRLEAARRRVEGMGGRLTSADAAMEIFLRSFSSDAAAT